MTLTSVMRQCVAGMRQYNNMIDRYPGGFWRCGSTGGLTFGTSTVEALVGRGIAEYTEWRDGRKGRFPIRARLAQQHEGDPHD